MRPNQTLAGLTARCIERIDEVLAERQPDCVVAQGDTTTVMCASLAAFYRRLPFVHVEAGLRTGDIHSPFPEELNRRVATLTTALLWSVERERGRSAEWAAKHAMLGDRRMVLITGHRRENFGGGFENICRAIAELAVRFPNVAFVYPAHLNPNVQEPVRRLLSECRNVHLLPPAPYPEFVWLMDRSTLILTDSGGVQEEAPSLKKPILVMRDTTERPEALDAGAVELVGTDTSRIVAGISRLLSDYAEYARRQIECNPYGDGHAATRIVELLLQRHKT